MAGSMIVVGGGLFGCWAALLLASRGAEVVLVEQAKDLLTRASWVNQARLHTGLHYPRSLLTARDALARYQRFRAEFPDAVRDFAQIYAIARHGSRTTASGFADFIERLGLPARQVDASTWLHPGAVEAAWEVEEPSFDAQALRAQMLRRLAAQPRVTLRTGVPVTSARAHAGGVEIRLADGSTLAGDEVVIATYAGINPLREQLGLPPLALSHELTEVVLGRVDAGLRGRGFTVMDGPFWSLMPFGWTEYASLTSVGLTPVARADGQPAFPCQTRRRGCTPLTVADCNDCAVRPVSLAEHQIQQMSLFLKSADSFVPERSLWTVKTVLRAADVNDARPTVVRREEAVPVWTVFSGKVSTIFDLEEALG